MATAAWICLFAPLAACVAIALLGERISRIGAGVLSTLSVFVAFGAALADFAKLLGEPTSDRTHVFTAWTWATAGTYHFDLSVQIDQLSVFMMLIVSGVGALIVGYSLGYMDGDDEERRYFAYMALFVFSMLLLVEAANFLILLAGWGMVGLSSYLLIGFWHQRASAVAAAKKAFIMNAVGDATMALALFALVQHVHSLNYSTVFAAAPGLSSNHWLVNLVALGLLGGAVAKSAQLPLHTWLPDAMEGPTPVSALIHAATMVTAGVYLIVRTHALFEIAPKVQDLAAGLGCATLLMAGLIALVQTDIKRVIAYSTMSQIGYMFLGAGLGAYSSGMFHLMTHAFFKATLFLAAGLVIHALGGEQDIRKMGGLRRLMPWTTGFFLAGSLALAGIPPFAGFWSKDPIISAATDHGTYGWILWVGALAGTFLTGLYTFRLFFRAFGGEPSAYVREHIHHGEGPWTMTIPVGILAALAVIGGGLHVTGLRSYVGDWLNPVAPPLVEPTHTAEAITTAIAIALGLLGIGVAWWIYSARRRPAPRPSSALEHKLWFDELYDALFYRPAVGTALFFYGAFERPIAVGSISEIAAAVGGLGRKVAHAQTGFLRSYVLAIAASLAVIAVIFVAVR
jgi:NADH-quinone oxidoreductase subunit L